MLLTSLNFFNVPQILQNEIKAGCYHFILEGYIIKSFLSLSIKEAHGNFTQVFLSLVSGEDFIGSLYLDKYLLTSHLPSILLMTDTCHKKNFKVQLIFTEKPSPLENYEAFLTPFS